jgi:predicted transcriptional regulator
MTTEYMKFGTLKIFFLPLYTRLKKEKLLDQFTRGEIFGYIVANPGGHYNAIKKRLNLSNGPLLYHLSVLEREKLIKSEIDGRFKRFYPSNGSPLSFDSINLLTAAQRHVYEVIRKNPGTSQKDIAEILGETKQVVNYHIRFLKERGFIYIKYEGKKSLCFVRK